MENTNTTAFLLLDATTISTSWKWQGCQLLREARSGFLYSKQSESSVFQGSWDCQRKTQLSRANTDHTIKLHQSGKHLIYNWTFPETSPWISLSHSSATQPAQVCSSYIMAAPIPLVHPRGHLWHHRNSHAHRYITIKDLFLSTWGVSLTTQVKQALGGPGMQGRTTVPLKFPKATLSQWGTGIGRYISSPLASCWGI